MKIELYSNSHTPKATEFNSFTFPGGEQHVRFAFNEGTAKGARIFARLNNSDAIMQLLLSVNAIRQQFGDIPIRLTVPYFPYARQDRVCVEGEAFALEIMTKLINDLNCDQITVFDAHSPVTLNQLNNAININQTALISLCPELCARITDGDVQLVAPDKGARGKVHELATHFGIENVVVADKVRNARTGHIEDVQIHGDVAGKDLLIVDDICDGGRTFIELAKKLKQQGANHISLYVTHGIFSKGLTVFEGLVDTIYTTDALVQTSDAANQSNVELKIIPACNHF